MKIARFVLTGITTLALLSGCSTAKKPPTSTRQEKLAISETPTALIDSTDPCAMRLHDDILGALLLYIARHNDLPSKLDDLKKLSDQELVFACPESKLPYVYNPEGIFMQEMNARLVVYDAAPTHKGYRLGIIIGVPQPGQPVIGKMIPVAESFFLLHPPEKPSQESKK